MNEARITGFIGVEGIPSEVEAKELYNKNLINKPYRYPSQSYHCPSTKITHPYTSDA